LTSIKLREISGSGAIISSRGDRFRAGRILEANAFGQDFDHAAALELGEMRLTVSMVNILSQRPLAN
jgi:hypothetical protein